MIGMNIAPAPRARARARRKVWPLLLGGALLLAAIGLVSVAGVVGWNLTHPERTPVTVRPESFQLPYEEVQFASEWDQTPLKGWLIPAAAGADGSGRIVIFAHGYTNNRSSEKAALPTAKALREHGIASLLFDFRNSGESGGTSTSVGQYETYDLLAAIAFAKERGYRQIGLLGYSMGASTSLLAAAKSSDVKAVVADSPFADLRPYLEENLPVWSGLPAFPFTPLVLWTTPLLTGMDPDQVRPVQAMAALRDRPVLLIHARGDGKIPARNSEVLQQASGSSRTSLWIAPGDRHVGAYEAVPDEYLQRVTNFFQEALQP